MSIASNLMDAHSDWFSANIVKLCEEAKKEVGDETKIKTGPSRILFPFPDGSQMLVTTDGVVAKTKGKVTHTITFPDENE